MGHQIKGRCFRLPLFTRDTYPSGSGLRTVIRATVRLYLRAHRDEGPDYIINAHRGRMDGDDSLADLEISAQASVGDCDFPDWYGYRFEFDAYKPGLEDLEIMVKEARRIKRALDRHHQERGGFPGSAFGFGQYVDCIARACGVRWIADRAGDAGENLDCGEWEFYGLAQGVEVIALVLDEERAAVEAERAA